MYMKMYYKENFKKKNFYTSVINAICICTSNNYDRYDKDTRLLKRMKQDVQT